MNRTSHSPELLEVARGLVIYESALDPLHKPNLPAAFRVCDKLRQRLTRLAGVNGFRLLLARALTLAKTRASGGPQQLLNALRVKPDGSLDFDPSCQWGRPPGLQPAPTPASPHTNGDNPLLNENDAAVILTVELLALLVAFVGEAFTLSLLHDIWPGFSGPRNGTLEEKQS